VDTYDVIVLGLGAVGAATARALALDGTRVLGLDRFAPPHERGSSHGDTRITRLAVGEGAPYAPLVRRSHEIWRELEAERGTSLLVECGGLVMGVPGATGQHGAADFVGATLSVAEDAGIAHERLDAAAIAERFGVFSVTTESGYYEPTAGYLRAEACVAAQLASAAQHGAHLRTNEPVLAWRADADGVEVRTPAGRYGAARLVLAAGAWIGALAPPLAPRFRVHRQVLYWFEVTSDAERLAAMPVFIWMHGTTPGEFCYGFPALDGPRGGVKVATEQLVVTTEPDEVERTVSAAEVAQMYETHVRGRIAGLGPRVERTATCLYTVTADSGFVIDRHPDAERVIVLSPCSGHGFKHSAAVGEIGARLALGTDPGLDLTPFSLARLA
jgi:sarcosine oxidase